MTPELRASRASDRAGVRGLLVQKPESSVESPALALVRARTPTRLQLAGPAGGSTSLVERARRREPSALEREHFGEPVKVVVVVDHTGARFLRARSD